MIKDLNVITSKVDVKLLSPAEVISILKISHSTFRRWAKAGIIPAFQIRSRWYVYEDKFKEMINKGFSTQPMQNKLTNQEE